MGEGTKLCVGARAPWVGVVLGEFFSAKACAKHTLVASKAALHPDWRVELPVIRSPSPRPNHGLHGEQNL